MTARRLHWDDMLVNGIPIPDHVHLSDAELYAIIAAVEDWQRQRGPSLTEFIEMDDAIKRVRDVTVPVPGDVYDLDSYTRGAADALALTNKALDGDA